MADPATDPGTHTELSPDELDRLEDALERWTAADFEAVPEDSQVPGPLRERLDAYRRVLAVTREALPLEDAGDDLLAGVFAEAHRPPGKPQREAAVAGPSLWERLRRSLLLPGVALAGSAALLLWVVQPGGDAPAGEAGEMVAKTERKSAQLAPDVAPAPAAPTSPTPLPGAAAEVDKDMSEGTARTRAADAPADALAEPPPAPAAATPLPEPKADKRASTKAGGGLMKKEAAAPIESLPGLDDAGPTQDGDKEDLRNVLEQADHARRVGDCHAAMRTYVRAMDMAGPDRERAQVFGGYALCLESLGEVDKADRYTAQARKLWSGITDWMTREGPEGTSAKKPAKAKPKSPKPLVEPAL